MSSSDDFEARLRDARAKAIAQGIVEPTEEERSPDEDLAEKRGFGTAYRLAIEMVAGVIVGLVLGIPLDDYFGTKPLFLIVFLLLGFAAGLLNVFRGLETLNAGLQDEEKADKRPPES